MHLVVYISLNAIYFLFGVLLVNTIRKEFFRQAEDKVFKKLEIDDIFIPDNKNKNNYYLNEILKMKKHPKYIFIFPESNRLVNLDEFWNILRLKYYRHLKFLHNFIVPTYDIDTISDVRRLETDIYTKHSFPLMFILKKKNSKNKIYQLASKKNSYDLISYCQEHKYHIIQLIEDSIFKTDKKIFMLETYLLLVRRPPTQQKNKDSLSTKEKSRIHQGSIEMYRYANIRYMLLDAETNKLINCQKVAELFENDFYRIPYHNLHKYINLNYKFIRKNFLPEFENMHLDLQSTCFEILSLKYLINNNFQTFLYEINRNVDFYGGLDGEVFTDLIEQTQKCVKKYESYDPEKLIKIC